MDNLAAYQGQLGQGAGNARQTSLALGDGLFGRLNQQIQTANGDLARIAQALEQAGDRVFGCQPKPVTDTVSDRREPFSAADALTTATEQTHRLIKEIDDQLNRLLGGF